MISSQPSVSSNGGPVFGGNITAARDITINIITEIHQSTKTVHERCRTAGQVPRDLLSRLDGLDTIAEFVESYASSLITDLSNINAQTRKIHVECTTIASELQRLASFVENAYFSNEVESVGASMNRTSERIMQLRSSLLDVQTDLSGIHNHNKTKDVLAIKDAVILSLDKESMDSDDTSSLRSFVTASSIQFVDRRMWYELERALSANFSRDFLRDNFALIITIVEEALWGHAAWAWTDTLQTGAEDSTDSGHHGDEELRHVSRQSDLTRQKGSTKNDFLETSRSNTHVYYENWDCMISFDGGGGSRTWSSALIIQALMEEIVDYERSMEEVFTAHPRKFEAGDLRPCHYFDTIYGGSLGGLLAICFGRLRMTVDETLNAYYDMLHARYGHPGPKAIAHTYFEAKVSQTIQAYCKEHEPGACDGQDRFSWRREESATNDHLCQTVVITELQSQLCAYLLRTHNHRYAQLPIHTHALPALLAFNDSSMRAYNKRYARLGSKRFPIYNAGTENLTVDQAARATAAWTRHLGAVTLRLADGHTQLLSNAGPNNFRTHRIAYSETALRSGPKRPSFQISIGMGLESMFADFENKKGLVYRYSPQRAVLRFLAAGLRETEQMIREDNNVCFERFSVVDDRLRKWKPANWKAGLYSGKGNGIVAISGGETLSIIRLATSTYLALPSQRARLKQTAERLVRIRRARELAAMTAIGERREKWEAYLGKHLPGERAFLEKYNDEWEFAWFGRKEVH